MGSVAKRKSGQRYLRRIWQQIFISPECNPSPDKENDGRVKSVESSTVNDGQILQRFKQQSFNVFMYCQYSPVNIKYNMLHPVCAWAFQIILSLYRCTHQLMVGRLGSIYIYMCVCVCVCVCCGVDLSKVRWLILFWSNLNL